MIRDVAARDSGEYECQVAGPRHSSLNRSIHLTVIGQSHQHQYLGSLSAVRTIPAISVHSLPPSNGDPFFHICVSPRRSNWFKVFLMANVGLLITGRCLYQPMTEISTQHT